MPARKTICPAPRDKERLSRIWVRGCHTSLVKQASNKKKPTNKQKKKKQKLKARQKQKQNEAIFYKVFYILPAFAHKFNWSLWHFIHLNSLLFYLFNNLFNFIDIFLKNLSVLSPKSFKVMQRLGSLSVWLQYLREVGI